MYRILYTVDSLVELFGVEARHIKMWTRVGALPSEPGKGARYDKNTVDAWVAAGSLNKLKATIAEDFKHSVGMWCQQQ